MNCKAFFTVHLVYDSISVKKTLQCLEAHFMEVVNFIRKLREEKGISQTKMAKDLQVTRQTIHAIENNKYNPSLKLALKLIAYFDVTIEEIFILKEED